MLGLERFVDVLVELLVGACGFRRVEVASARDVAVGGVKVQRLGDDVEFGE